MTSASAVDPADEASSGIPEEETYRAQVYALLSRLLAAPADAALLQALTRLEGDRSELGQALAALADAAAGAAPAAIAEEYHDLFIGIGRGELVPYGSYYLTGFLQERPLALLRRDLKRLGVERAAETAEPEDHIAALTEIMAGLIGGGFGRPAPLALQRDFFARHVAPWAGRFFGELERAEKARFYRLAGRIGRLFIGIEQTAFAMAA